MSRPFFHCSPKMFFSAMVWRNLRIAFNYFFSHLWVFLLIYRILPRNLLYWIVRQPDKDSYIFMRIICSNKWPQLFFSFLFYRCRKTSSHFTCLFRLTNENQIKLLIRVIVNIWQPIQPVLPTHKKLNAVRNSAKYVDRCIETIPGDSIFIQFPILSWTKLVWKKDFLP